MVETLVRILSIAESYKHKLECETAGGVKGGVQDPRGGGKGKERKGKERKGRRQKKEIQNFSKNLKKKLKNYFPLQLSPPSSSAPSSSGLLTTLQIGSTFQSCTCIPEIITTQVHTPVTQHRAGFEPQTQQPMPQQP